MKKILYILTFIFYIITTPTYSQALVMGNNFIVSKEFSKETALFQAKNYLVNDIFGSSTEVVKFEALALAATTSGELTTLVYKCESKQKEGLILGFYGIYWNDEGVVYQGYAFKDFDKVKAHEFLNTIQKAVDENLNYVLKDSDNNFYLKYDDIDILISSSNLGYEIRLFWNDFDSSWEKTAFDRSKRRFEKHIK